MVSHMQLVKSS